MLSSNKDILRQVFHAVLIISLFCFRFISQTVAQTKCTTAVTDGHSMYDIGRSAEVILLLSHCLPDNIPESERDQAYRLLALSYLAEDFDNEARDAVKKLLDLKENFQPDTRDDEKFKKLIEEEKFIREKKKKKKKTWLFITGGVVLAGTTTAVIAIVKGGPSAQRLPDPPAFPDDN